MDAVPNAPEERRAREDTLKRLMSAYGSQVLRVCYLYLKDYALAQDAAQTTFMKVWRAIDTLREGTTEKAWVMRIAANTCKNICKSRDYRFFSRSTPIDRLPEPTAEDLLPDDTVLRAVLSLPEKYREVVVLHYYQGLTLSEVAQTLDLSHASVRTRIHRARRQLEPLLKGWYLGDE